MQKLKSYLGLALATFLGWLFLWPQPPSLLHESMRITSLDRTAISLILQTHNAGFDLLRRVEGYARRCPRGPETKGQWYGQDRCAIRNAAPGPMQMIKLQDRLQRLDPGFSKALDDYLDSYHNHANPQDPDVKQKQAEVEQQAMATYPKLMKELRSNYITAVYASHALFIAVLMLLILFRRPVGATLLWPFTATFRMLGMAHEKV